MVMRGSTATGRSSATVWAGLGAGLSWALTAPAAARTTARHHQKRAIFLRVMEWDLTQRAYPQSRPDGHRLCATSALSSATVDKICSVARHWSSGVFSNNRG